jgi:hypothetical protein
MGESLGFNERWIDTLERMIVMIACRFRQSDE